MRHPNGMLKLSHPCHPTPKDRETCNVDQRRALREKPMKISSQQHLTQLICSSTLNCERTSSSASTK